MSSHNHIRYLDLTNEASKFYNFDLSWHTLSEQLFPMKTIIHNNYCWENFQMLCSLPAISFCCPTFRYCFDKYSQFFKACICSNSHSNNAYAKSIFICEKGKQKQKLLTFDLYSYLVDKHLCFGSSRFSMSVTLISFCFLLKTLLFYHFNYTQKILPSLLYHLHPYEELRTTIKIFCLLVENENIASNTV